MATEDYATEAQIKRLYAVLHSIGRDPKEFKKVRNFSSYEKLTREQCSAFITELEEIEEQKKTKKEQDIKTGVQKLIPTRDGATVIDDTGLDEAHAEAEVSKMALVMRFCVREANAIVEQEIDGGGLSEASKAGILQRLATTMFIEAMKRGL